MTYENDLICSNLSVCGDDLLFAGVKVRDMAQKHGTPLYLFDESKVRENCRTYVNAMRAEFGNNFRVLYASKAASFKRIYEIINEEGVCADVVSCGEIATAKKAGFPLSRAFFHSNNKTDADIEYAIDSGIGYFVADNEEELLAIDKIAKMKGIVQNALLRLTPGIDPHTYEEVSTGKVDSKFGSPIETGQAEYVTKIALSLSSVKLCGYHCHVGSQVFDSDVYLQAVDIMFDFVDKMRQNLGYVPLILDLGGGYGVRYTSADPVIDIGANIRLVAKKVKEKCKALSLDIPEICLEPGRSIVANAGLTAYTVGTLKKIIGYKNYVSVDGGMTDNPRYALYKSSYTVLPANKMSEPRDMQCSLVGRCCESGDILQENIYLPSSIKRGDTVCVLTTGAYNYSMSSNYNRIPRPPIVMIDENKRDYVAVRRETYDDITHLDV